MKIAKIPRFRKEIHNTTRATTSYFMVFFSDLLYIAECGKFPISVYDLDFTYEQDMLFAIADALADETEDVK